MAPCAQTIYIDTRKETLQAAAQWDVEEATPAALRDAFRTRMELPASLEPHLRSALIHLLERPGSMARSRATLQVACAYRMERETALQLALGLEYFHTASLVFDDLPSMDNAARRRGAPCVHVVFGEAEAILAGLALINRAYRLIWQAMASCAPGTQQAAADYLERRLGLAGLLNGQSMDLHYAALPHTRQTTDRVASGKTTSLIRLTLVLPAILGGAKQGEIRLLERLAGSWGLGYQVLDDLRDVLQGEEESGKSTAKDAQLDRPNAAAVLGVPATVRRLKRMIENGSRVLEALLVARPRLQPLDHLGLNLKKELQRMTQPRVAAASVEG